ncbi:MAG: hypothetical protein GY925_06295 [Actinomycetia bacterium]|nr:hypothetical protein [Actinomycetes bacterium]
MTAQATVTHVEVNTYGGGPDVQHLDGYTMDVEGDPPPYLALPMLAPRPGQTSLYWDRTAAPVVFVKTRVRPDGVVVYHLRDRPKR